MPLTNIIPILTLLTLTIAANTTPTTTPEPEPEHYHYCEATTPINQVSPSSPLIPDCLQITTDLDDDEWSHKWRSCGQHSLVSYGTCVFGIETVPDDICYPYTTLEIGNGDIIDFINGSIERFAWEGRVGAMGYSRCHNVGRWRDDYLDVKWGVYHS